MNLPKQHNISFKGKGKWETKETIKAYRKKRDKANAQAKRSRRQNA